MQEIYEDIEMAKAAYGQIEQIFLCDGDALSRDTKDLLKIIHKIKAAFPNIRDIASYASAKGILRKSREELVLLKEAGLTKAYLGVESGDDAVLKETNKGVNAMETAEAGKAVEAAGIELFAIILIGLAGKDRSRENALATAKIINEIQPHHLAAMTYMPVPGTKLHRDIEAGKFEVLSDSECLRETKWLVEALDDRPMHFTSSHVSNYVSVDGDIAADKDKIIAALEDGIGKVSRVNSKRGL